MGENSQVLHCTQVFLQQVLPVEGESIQGKFSLYCISTGTQHIQALPMAALPCDKF